MPDALLSHFPWNQCAGHTSQTSQKAAQALSEDHSVAERRVTMSEDLSMADHGLADHGLADHSMADHSMTDHTVWQITVQQITVLQRGESLLWRKAN